MAFRYDRTIRLADTDAAGMVFFARTLALCHEAYEASLAAAGINLNDFLGGTGIVVPIARSEAEYLRPLRCGDRVRVSVAPELISEQAFAIRFEVVKPGPPEKVAARVRTEHICTSPARRQRAAIPATLVAWVRGGQPG